MKKLKYGSLGFFTIFLYIFLLFLFNNFFDYTTNNYYLNNLLLLIPLLLVSIVLGIIYHKTLINDLKNFKKEFLNIGIRYWLLAYILMFIINNILVYFQGNIAANEEINRQMLDSVTLYAVFSMCFFGPFCEEICFRLGFRKAFSNPTLYAIFTSLLFGFLHVMNFNLNEFLFIIPYTIVGYAFALSYIKTNNIWTSIILHIIHNSVVIFLILISKVVL